MYTDDPPDREQTRKLQRSIHLSHHSNNKTKVLPTFQVYNLLTGTLLLSTVLFTKTLQKFKKKLKTRFFIFKKLKKVKRFYIYGS